MSDEEEAQVGHLVYIPSHGCKENLVARPHAASKRVRTEMKIAYRRL